MRTLVIGLDCAAPELIFGDEKLSNLRRLMELGCWGKLESVNPPITIPAWLCLATSQDPGSVGVYGFRNRADYSYGGLVTANSRTVREITIWDQLAREGGKSILLGVPPSYPPRRVNGISVGCFMTPDPSRNVYTHPERIQEEIRGLVGEYVVDVKEYRTEEKERLKAEVYAMTRKRFKVARHLLENHEWDYFQMVEIGLDRLQHGFWQYQDQKHIHYEPGNKYEQTLKEYYRYLDEEIGELLGLLDEDVVVAVLSDHGAQRLDGGFCVNQWLVEEGLLALEEYPQRVSSFGQLKVNWGKTRAWSEGGYYARVFFNVQGREPEGVIPAAEYESFREEMKEKFEGLKDDKGESLRTRVYVPEEIYRKVSNVAPDLIVHFGELYWRSIGSVGHGSLRLQENDTGPDGCNHALYGSFILAGGKTPLRGEVKGARLLDVAPTLLELGGHDLPDTMQGESLVRGQGLAEGMAGDAASAQEEEEIIRQRLTGLGYIS
jgi:predicted AlkP superfamily phosphohydrolase/phosphomutase